MPKVGAIIDEMSLFSRLVPLLAILSSTAALTACDALEAPAAPPQVIVVNVTSDPGVPLAGAVLLFDGNEVARTNESGRGQLQLNGNDGQTFHVMVKCPKGYDSPSRPVVVQIKRLADKNKFPEYAVSCPPKERAVVVAVRAQGGTNLPVLHLGQEVARTDESGAAHVLLNLAPGETFELQLDTEAKTDLKPQNPVQGFSVASQDDVFLFDQKFESTKPKVVYRGGPVKPTLPERIP